MEMTGTREAWNKGKLVGQKPPLKPKDIWAIRIHLQTAHAVRDLAMFNLAIDSKLRGPNAGEAFPAPSTPTGNGPAGVVPRIATARAPPTPTCRPGSRAPGGRRRPPRPAGSNRCGKPTPCEPHGWPPPFWSRPGRSRTIPRSRRPSAASGRPRVSNARPSPTATRRRRRCSIAFKAGHVAARRESTHLRQSARRPLAQPQHAWLADGPAFPLSDSLPASVGQQRKSITLS